MNKPENVPIATLSGVASLTEVVGELPLPSFGQSSQQVKLFPSEEQSQNALEHIYNHHGNVSPEISGLLSRVNNAYLDFKNTIYNRPLHESDSVAPMVTSLLKQHPNVFQPQFENYHGSPLKGSGMQAYSTNQRHAFYLHHQPPPLCHAANLSPLFHGSAGSSSPLINSPNMAQILTSPRGQQQHISSPAFAYRNMSSPQFVDRASQNIKSEANSHIPRQHPVLSSQTNCISRLRPTPAATTTPSSTQQNNPAPTSSLKSKPLVSKKKTDKLLVNGCHSPMDKTLELKVPKLIVRKVKRFDGDREVETLEVYNSENDRSYITTPEKTLDPSKGIKRKKILNRKLSESSDDNTTQDAKRSRSLDDDDCIEERVGVKRFAYILNKIIDHEQELVATGVLDITDDIGIPPETLIPRPLISKLCAEICKMKVCGNLKEVPVSHLIMVIMSMDRHVRETQHLVTTQDTIEDEGKKWSLIQFDRILRSLEAASVILNIRTASNMPKQVYVEEALENILTMCQHHLENTVFPSMDPIYKIPGAKNDEPSFVTKAIRSKAIGTQDKHMLQIYNKLCEIVSLLVDTIGMETLNDSTLLKLSQVVISPFFVECVNVLQLSALRVARSIFRHYVKHRDLIMDDILVSLARLPSSKKNLRSFALKDNTNIQMFTALLLQLVQSMVQMPAAEADNTAVDADVIIVKSYEDALRVVQRFMSVFLKKCSPTTSRDDTDYRPLFENFLHDLFVTSSLPEWPAAEVLLTQLSHLLMVTLNNNKVEASLRCSALDYLSQIAAHLRKSLLSMHSEEKNDKLKGIVEKLINDATTTEEIPIVDDMSVYEEKMRKCLLFCLNNRGKDDESFKFAREFYIGQWLHNVQLQIEKHSATASIPGSSDRHGDDDVVETTEQIAEKMQILQERKEFYRSLIKDNKKVTIRQKSLYCLTYTECSIVIDHLSVTRSRNFDLYMKQICRMLNEQVIGLRAKAMKALTAIVSVDPSILAQKDVKASVYSRLLDPSTNVREAVIDLIGQFVLRSPELVNQYYEMIVERILDTGVSVRKRVIKILRDICVENPEFDKIPDICARIIRRVDDELGIRKLVTDVFRTMWFQPVANGKTSAALIYQKAVNIAKVADLCRDSGFEWVESLLHSLLDPKNPTLRATTLTACQQLVDCLFQRLLKPELKPGRTMTLSCLLTLNLFCKACPALLVPHTTSLQPYLSTKISNLSDLIIIQQVSKILELVVPLMERPNQKFLVELEEDIMKLLLQQSQNVVHSCVSCLTTIVIKVTHNYKFVIDAYNRFLQFLTAYQREYCKSPSHQVLKSRRPTLLRSLFTIGLFCRYFDMDYYSNEEQTSVKPLQQTMEVFRLCMFFTDSSDEEVSLKALQAIGFIGVRYPQYLLFAECRVLYAEVLGSSSLKAKVNILKSLQNHLAEEETRMNVEPQENGNIPQDTNGESSCAKTSIKEMGDNMSGYTSELVQTLLVLVMKNFFDSDQVVRISALQVVTMVLSQGLVHPAQCVPYLVAISSDSQKICQVKAEQCLTGLDSRFPGFLPTQAFHGVKMAYELQKTIQKNNNDGYLPGFRETENKVALINHVYSLIRSNKQNRRAFLKAILKLVESATKDMAYFLVENLAYLNYNVIEEPMFIIHTVNTSVANAGASILYNLKELLRDEDEKLDEILKGVDVAVMRRLVTSSYNYVILLELKKYLKSLYGITNSKCNKYSPSEPSKLYDKTVTRKQYTSFTCDHKSLIFCTESLSLKEMFVYYLKFKQTMASLDPDSASDSECDRTIKTESLTNSLNSTQPLINQDLINHTEVKPQSVRTRRRSSRSSRSSCNTDL